MKRDMDLAREILIKLEDSTAADGYHFVDVEIDGRPAAEISYHIQLLAEAGLVEAKDLTTSKGPCWKPKKLTFQGHEFLDASRKDSVWNKAKEIVKEKAGSLSFEAMKTALSIVVQNSLLNG